MSMERQRLSNLHYQSISPALMFYIQCFAAHTCVPMQMSHPAQNVSNFFLRKFLSDSSFGSRAMSSRTSFARIPPSPVFDLV